MNGLLVKTSTPILLSLGFVICTQWACGGPELSSTVPLKRGSLVRFINLTSSPATAKCGSRPLPTFDITSGDAPFVLMPPSSKSLELMVGDKPISKNIELLAGETYTFVCIDDVLGPQCIEFQNDSPRAAGGGSNIRVLNLTKSTIKTSKPESMEVSTKSGSKTLTLAAGNVQVSGTAGGKVFQASADLKPNGAYVSLVYATEAGIEAKMFYSNPPMQAAGMTNPNR